MQKLKQRTKKNTPTDASQVRSNCGLPLNKEEILSVVGSKTCFNTPEVNPSQQAGRLKVNVLVLSIEGKPLMPCTSAKAKKLINSARAKVIRRFPFVIQLNFECENQVQEVKAGIDKGSKFIGFSFVTDKKELAGGELKLDQKTSERITSKRMYRNGRRNKLWYREPKFLNRGSQKEGWLPPSTQRKIDTHIRLFELYKKYLPVTELNVEIANFDIQKMMNPEIEGTDYQQGNLYEYENVKAFVIAREHGKCQFCSKEYDGNGWHLHHIVERANGGTNRPDNIALLHKNCHKKLHKKGMKLKKNTQYKDATFMNTAKNFIIDGLKEKVTNLNLTYGYITKINRNQNNIEKSHVNDAFVIAGGTNQERCKPVNITQKHRNNRSLGMQRKGFATSTRTQRYGIQPNDLVWIDGKKYTTAGTHHKGKAIVLKESKKSIVIKKIEKVFHFGNLIFN